MTKLFSISVLLLSALVGCSPPAPDAAPDPAPALEMNDLTTALVSPGPRPNTVVVEYRNGTANDVVVNEQVITTNCLALEVRDSTGRRVAPVPPSVPWPRDNGVRIPAGGVHRVEYDLHMFSPPLPPGRYQVLVRIEGWSCKPLEYDVVAERE